MTKTDPPGRRLLPVSAALERLRDQPLPRAPTLASLGDAPPPRPLDGAEINARDRPVTLRLAYQRGSLPPIPKPDAAELAGRVERCAAATWGAWISGTSAPGWDELPEHGRERVRAAVRAGLVAAGLVPEPGGPLSRLGLQP